MNIQPGMPQNIYQTAGMQQVAGPQMAPAEEVQGQQATQAPFDMMQAKTGLDLREDAYRAIVERQQGEAVDAKQDKITDDELKQIFGDQADAVRGLLSKRSDVKLSELLPLRKDTAGFSQVLKQLTDRTDLQVSDLVNKTPDGKVQIDKSVSDDETKELMENRQDIKPKELTDLRAQLIKTLGNPVMAKKAFTLAMKLLKTRTDMKPDAVGKMFTNLSELMDSIKPPGGSKGASAAATKLEMMETSVELLCTRRDLNEEHVIKLARSTVETMGDKNDPMSQQRVSRSFKDAADLLAVRGDMSVDQVTSFQKNLKQMVPGKDAAVLDNRAAMFSTACQTLKSRPDMNFDQMTELLKRQTQGNNPKKGNALMNSFNEGVTGLGKGKAMDEIAPPVTTVPQKQGEKAGDKDKKDVKENEDKEKGPEGPEDKEQGAQAPEKKEEEGPAEPQPEAQGPMPKQG
ncbi:MAG: hypothetical protein RDV48_27790 [Candidatus Eremiobacteraeota bacterium]|nr:hypothetical protein [Candidatus Eremiobacteraeota bacterium]